MCNSNAFNPLDRREEQVRYWMKRSVLFGGHVQSPPSSKVPPSIPGSSITYPMESTQTQKEISWQHSFSTYFLSIVRSRNSCSAAQEKFSSSDKTAAARRRRSPQITANATSEVASHLRTNGTLLRRSALHRLDLRPTDPAPLAADDPHPIHQ
jgi:hypothetical protein